MSNDATNCRAGDRMMTRDMAGNTTDRGSFQATVRVGGHWEQGDE
jgi:hypothetical protein